MNIYQVIDLVAPTIALRMRMKNDNWVKLMVIHLQMTLFDHPMMEEDDEHTKILKNEFDDAIRNEMAKYFLRKIRSVADNKNRTLMCRKWIIDEARSYATIAVIFTNQKSYSEEVAEGRRHPCNAGLWEQKQEVIETLFAKSPSLAKKIGINDTISEVETLTEKLRKEYLWLHTRLNFANLGRLNLGDKAPQGKKDWFRTYISYLIAKAEIDIRTSMGWPVMCSSCAVSKEMSLVKNLLADAFDNLGQTTVPCLSNTLQEEILTIENDILAGKSDPLERIGI